MRKKNLLVLVVAGLVVVMLGSCSDKSAEKTAEQAKAIAEKTEQMAKKAADETKEAVTTAANWTKEKMDEYLEKMSGQLNGFDDKLKDLAAKADGLTGDAQKKFKEQYAELIQKKDEAAKEMEALKEAGGDAWTAAKDRFEAVMKEIKALYDKMIAEFAST